MAWGARGKCRSRFAITSPPPSNPSLVLVVDDDPHICKKVTNLLGDKAGYHVTTATSPEQALDRISPTPDLAFIDLHFTSYHLAEGIGLTRRLREVGYENALCVLSADVRWELVYDALLAGADDYHSKLDVTRHLIRNAHALIELFTARDRKAPGFDPVVDGCFLRSRNVSERRRRRLRAWNDAGFPDLKSFSARLGIEQGTLNKQFHDIRKQLGLDTNYQLAILVATLTGYGARLRDVGENLERE